MALHNPLQDLLRGQSQANVPLRLAALRQQLLREDRPRRGVDVSQLEQDIAEDPFTGEAAQQETAERETFEQGLQTFQRPEVRAVREEERAGRIAEKVAPAEVAGRYGVEAARIAGPYRVSAAEATAQGRADVAAQQAAQRGEGIKAQALRQRLANLQKRGRPGFLADQLFGAGKKYDVELEQILQQLGISPDEAGAEGAPTRQAPVVGARKMIGGILGEWDGQNWVAVE